MKKCLGEFVGTYLLVLLGCGAVHSSVLTGSQNGLWQVAVVWGIAIMLATYVVGAVSGAHINPAMTLAFAVRGRFSWRWVPPYILAQVAGAFVAAATLFVLFEPFLAAKEQEKRVTRGQAGSEITAMCYGEYFPSPGPLASGDGPYSQEARERLDRMVSQPAAFLAEALGTLILAMVVFAVTDRRNRAGPTGRFAPVFIGLTVAALISVLAPLTQACFNPARDFGPRLFASLAGWGNIALPGTQGAGFLTVYVLAPTLGAMTGALSYDWLLRPSLPIRTHEMVFRRVPMQRISLIMVGGFLGAGKTTLLADLARRLAARGKRIGLVSNDQAPNLVDTALLAAGGAAVQEVSGGCFCCRFDNLVASLERLAESQPDVLIGEPVGSCTDLSATVIGPMKQLHGGRFHVAPFSVLVDPYRAIAALGDRQEQPFPGEVVYIFEKQLEEADVIVLNKADVLPAAELDSLRRLLADRFPGKPVFVMSALRGEGVDQWLDYVSQDRPAGQTIAELDYDRYAAGEAALGWLNAAIRLESAGGADWAAFCRDLVAGIQDRLSAGGHEVAHLKLRLAAGEGSLVANLTSSRAAPFFHGTVAGSPRSAQLLVNVRAHVAPEVLRQIVETSLANVAGAAVRMTIVELQSFSPARPQPTHRFAAPARS